MTSSSGKSGECHSSDSVTVYRQAVGTDGSRRNCSSEGLGDFFFEGLE